MPRPPSLLELGGLAGESGQVSRYLLSPWGCAQALAPGGPWLQPPTWVVGVSAQHSGSPVWAGDLSHCGPPTVRAGEFWRNGATWCHGKIGAPESDEQEFKTQLCQGIDLNLTEKR